MLDSSMVRITLVRHGESLANRAGRWQGQGDSPLSPLGERQAWMLAQRLREQAFDRVISSDLTRAADTARSLGRPVDLRPEFREFDVGRWEGLTREEVQERFPEELERLKNGGDDTPLGGGESQRTFSRRVDEALGRLRAELRPGQNALIVCHGGVIASLLAGVLGIRGQNRWPFLRVSNTSVTELAFSANSVALSVFNDTLHLSSLGSFPACEGPVGAVALVADDHPDQSFGAFAEHYDIDAQRAEPRFDSLLSFAGSEGDVAGVRALLADLTQLHGAQRVSLSTAAHTIHSFAQHLVGVADPRAGLAPPARGALCHVAVTGGAAHLLDYGVLPESS